MSKFPVGGVSAALLARIVALENEVSALKKQKATGSEYGLVKLSNASDVTESEGLAVPASELNSTVEGTVKNLLNTLTDQVGVIRHLPFIQRHDDVKEMCNAICNSARSVGNLIGLTSGALSTAYYFSIVLNWNSQTTGIVVYPNANYVFNKFGNNEITVKKISADPI